MVSKLFIRFLKEHGIYKAWVKATNAYRSNIRPRRSFKMRMRMADRGEIKPEEIMLWSFTIPGNKISKQWPLLLQQWDAYYEKHKKGSKKGGSPKMKRTKK